MLIQVLLLISLLTCLGQAFFALGLGMLGSMVFGSYIKDKDENIFRTFFSNLYFFNFCRNSCGAAVTFPMVFGTNLEVTEGVSLSFLTLPNAFNLVHNWILLIHTILFRILHCRIYFFSWSL